MKAGRKKNDQRNAKGEWVPTEEQEECVRLKCYSAMENKEICSQIKITEQTYYNWCKDDNFKEYKEKQRKELFEEFGIMVDKSLLRKAIEEGSVSAIRTYYEKRGEINSDKEQQASTIVINVSHD